MYDEAGSHMTKRWVLLACVLVGVELMAALALTQSAPAAPGRVIVVAGHRMHIHCVGKGSPAVVFISGAGDFSFDWALVHPAVARSTTACSYDRSGFAWSELGAKPRTWRQEVHDLAELLKNSGVRGPYIVVGQSMGGLIARTFQRRYLDNVAGMVLVDATSEDAVLNVRGEEIRVRLKAAGRPIPEPRDSVSKEDGISAAERQEAEIALQSYMRPAIELPFQKLPAWAREARLWALSRPEHLVGDQNDLEADEFAELYAHTQSNLAPLGTTPLVVLTQGRSPGSQERQEQQRRMAALSRNSAQIIATSSAHQVQLDDSQLVECAIARVIEAANRNGTVAVTSCRPR